jgi:SNF2 family DNA or RNA helicase
MTAVVNGQRKTLEPYLYDTVEYWQHQLEGVRWLVKHQNFLLADDMGLGKTLEAITTAAVDMKRGWATKILVVAPVSLKGNWEDEIQKFTTIRSMVLGQKVIPGKPGHPDRISKVTPAKRAEQMDDFMTWEGVKILITNYEQIVAHVDELNKMKFDIIVYDEAHYLKNPKSKRTKACLKLSAARHFLLTGTPFLNTVDELWPLLHKIAPAEFPRYWGFRNRYCVMGGFEGKQIIGIKNEKELTEKLQSHMLRRMKKDVLDLPEVQIIKRSVDLDPKQRAIYDRLIDDMVIEMDGEDKGVDNALVKFTRLKQLCGTTLPFTGEDVSSKLDLAIEDTIEVLHQQSDRPNKLVVFTQFRDVLEAYCQRLDKAAPDIDIWEIHGDVKTHLRQGVVKEWSNHPRPAVVACMTQVAGVGLNMTAARHGFFLDKLFVPGLNQQAIDRLHRIGADASQAVQIWEYQCKGTVEARVEEILHGKKKLFDTVVDESDFKRRLLAEMLKRNAKP